MLKIVLASLTAAALALPAAAQTLDRIKEKQQLVMGFRTDAAPMSFADSQGNPAGYTPLICVSVAQAIANVLGIEKMNVQFKPVGATDRFEQVASGEIDLLCGAATITLQRRELVDFSVPVFVDGISYMAPTGTVSDLGDLAGKKVGVRNGTTAQEAMTVSLAEAGINAETIAFDNHKDAFAAVESGQIDAYFADQSILVYLLVASGSADKLEVGKEILTIEKQGLAMARGDADFRLLVDTVLSEMFLTGDIVEVFKTALPGAKPGVAMEAMGLISPTMP